MLKKTTLTFVLAASAAILQAQGVTTTLPSLKPTPSQSSATSTTATTTKKSSNTGEIFRWVDAKGRVQYGADVPEEFRSQARKVDTRSNIVSSRVPARITAPQNQDAQSPETQQPVARKQVTEAEKCEAAWQEYRASQECFNQFRRGVAGAGRGTGLSPEAQTQCKDVTEPAACR